jgi:hypothetical protein
LEDEEVDEEDDEDEDDDDTFAWVVAGGTEAAALNFAFLLASCYQYH